MLILPQLFHILQVIMISYKINAVGLATSIFQSVLKCCVICIRNKQVLIEYKHVSSSLAVRLVYKSQRYILPMTANSTIRTTGAVHISFDIK